jgi:3-deoxy-D-manno-octulosonate 8-phosphate phosphatase (KDO 8-P phosphatase)
MKAGSGRAALTRKARKIRLLILDVDGVLTDGSIILDNGGNEYKSFHVRDGHGIKMLIASGVPVALITGRSSAIVERRAHELGIKDVFQKCFDKVAAYSTLLDKYSLSDDEVAYIGDDIVDIRILSRVGLPVAVADADREIFRYAAMTTTRGGGKGAVREITDFILKAKGLWKDLFDEYLKI